MEISSVFVRLSLNVCTVSHVYTHTMYRDVHNLREGYMYELYAMFENKVSIKEASDHCRALADQLWPNSRESVAPFSLIN